MKLLVEHSYTHTHNKTARGTTTQLNEKIDLRSNAQQVAFGEQPVCCAVARLLGLNDGGDESSYMIYCARCHELLMRKQVRRGCMLTRVSQSGGRSRGSGCTDVCDCNR